MWAYLGMASALGLAMFAFVTSRRAGGYYDAGVYGMTPTVHTRYALASLAFFVAFGALLVFRLPGITIVLFAAFVLLAVFYLTSFLRGFTDDQD